MTKREALWQAPAMFGVFLVINFVIWELLPSPPAYNPCDGERPPGYTADLHAFRAPTYILLGLFGAALAVWLLWSSWTQRGDRPGAPTIVAVALPAALGLASLVSPAARGLWVAPGVAGIAAIVTVLPVLVVWWLVLALGRTRPRGTVLHARATAWSLLYLGLPAAGLIAWLPGSDFSLGC
ncbi:MAG TPA: hypothetical protein VH817_11210 [Thermoleophilaceae bacterium]|jgi:hypothetical protein